MFAKCLTAISNHPIWCPLMLGTHCKLGNLPIQTTNSLFNLHNQRARYDAWSAAQTVSRELALWVMNLSCALPAKPWAMHDDTPCQADKLAASIELDFPRLPNSKLWLNDGNQPLHAEFSLVCEPGATHGHHVRQD